MTDEDKRIEKLQEQIEQLQTRKVVLKAIEEDPKAALGGMGLTPLDHITDEEKVAAFDELHGMAEQYVVKAIIEKYADSDDRYWFYEKVMTRTLGERVFEVLREYVYS